MNTPLDISNMNTPLDISYSGLLPYLTKTLGYTVSISPFKCPQLPLYLRCRYDLAKGKIFEKEMYFAIRNDDPMMRLTPHQYSDDQYVLSDICHEHFIFVIPQIESFERLRLIQLKVPFVVPGRQIFIPNFLVDLREHYGKPSPSRKRSLSPAAQSAVLLHLLYKYHVMLPLGETAMRLHYSAPMLTKVKSELVSNGICDLKRKGPHEMPMFRKTGKELWELASPFMSSPVKRFFYVCGNLSREKPILGGVSALSEKTLIADDSIKTYVLTDSINKALFSKRSMKLCDFERDATAKVEIWNYNPKYLTVDDHVVDPLSLYLCFRHSPDERIQHAIHEMLEKLSW